MLGDLLATEIQTRTKADAPLAASSDRIRVRIDGERQTLLAHERLALVFAAFENGKARLNVVSNFHDERGQIAPVRPHFVAISIKVSGTHVHVAGATNAVSSADRHRLKHLVEKRAAPEALLSALVAVNRKAALITDTVGPACWTSYLLPDGSVKDERFGDVGAEGFTPHSIMAGQDLAKIVHDLVDSGALTQHEPLASTELFDGRTWTMRAPMASPRAEHTAVLMSDRTVLVVGGLGPMNEALFAEIYDPATNSWTAGGQMREPRFGHAMSILHDGRVFVIAGEVLLRARYSIRAAAHGPWPRAPVKTHGN